MLIPLEECVSEAMVDGLGRLLSLAQHMVVQKYGSAVALLHLTQTHTQIATRTIVQYKFMCKQRFLLTLRKETWYCVHCNKV